MNANEARALMEKFAAEDVSVLRADIDGAIEKAARDGKAYAYYFGASGLQESDKRALIRSLEDDGYKVRYVADPDPGHPCSRPYHEISW